MIEIYFIMIFEIHLNLLQYTYFKHENTLLERSFILKVEKEYNIINVM